MTERRDGSRDVLTTRRGQLVAGGCAVAVLTGASLVAASGKVPGWEQAVFHGVNGLPDALRPAMWTLQLLGLLAVPALAALIAMVARQWWLALCLVALVPLKLASEKLLIKQLVERQRPATSICHSDLDCGHFRDVPIHGLSYVSGHAVVAWAVAWMVLPYLPLRWRVVALTLALLNSIARVYLGAHNPLDVVGGAALGVTIAAGLHLVLEPFRRDRDRGEHTPTRRPDAAATA